MSSNFLLTIAIPTYNRGVYLEQLLHSLSRQLDDYQDKVELLVVDNASPDSTSEIVNAFAKQHQLRYIKNDSNIGPDNNFIKCFSEAKGKYVLLFGDDDLFLEGALKYLIDVLEGKDYGVVHLSVATFTNEALLPSNDIVYNGGCHVVCNASDFIAQSHINNAFISACVVNKKFFTAVVPDLFLSSNLVQLHWTFGAILKSTENCIVKDRIIGGRLFNTSGYDFCKVFVVNLNKIVNYFVENGYEKNIFYGLFHRLLKVYYPANIVKIRNDHYDVSNNSCWSTFYSYYRYNIWFWLLTVPAIILPKRVAWHIFLLVDRVRKL